MKYSHHNLSPLDNRYRDKVSDITECFSESALIKVRFVIEIEWLIFLCTNYPKKFKPLSKASLSKLKKFKTNFSDKDVIKIKNIEKKTNHDVKAVEYFIRDYFKKDKNLTKYINLIHFGLTSEDVNSLSYAVMIENGNKILIKKVSKLITQLNKMSSKWKNITFLSRTHGQAASPSTLGKEIKVISKRLSREIETFKKIKGLAKFSGATGNYHTFNIVDSSINWQKANKRFINSFGIQQNKVTTQIEPHDWIAEVMHVMIRINNISIDLSQDMWTYISNDIFKMNLIESEVGSSTMPHKVNPIDFENAEGNLGIANTIFNFFSSKLPVSRLQRDLTDSTVLRNVGVPIGHTLIAFNSISNGLKKIVINQEIIKNDLDQNWVVVSEAIQTILRKEGFKNPYEILKDLTRNQKIIDKEKLHYFINKLDISNDLKNKLKKISPHNYIGILKS